MKGLQKFSPEYLEQHGTAGSKAIGTRLLGDSNVLFGWWHRVLEYLTNCCQAALTGAAAPAPLPTHATGGVMPNAA